MNEFLESFTNRETSGVKTRAFSRSSMALRFVFAATPCRFFFSKFLLTLMRTCGTVGRGGKNHWGITLSAYAPRVVVNWRRGKSRCRLYIGLLSRLGFRSVYLFIITFFFGNIYFLERTKIIAQKRKHIGETQYGRRDYRGCGVFFTFRGLQTVLSLALPPSLISISCWQHEPSCG